MIRIEMDKPGEFRVLPSDPESPAAKWLKCVCSDPFFASPASDRRLLQDASEREDVNEDWREYAEEEILATAALFREKFCVPSGGLRFTAESLPEFAAFLNRARLKIATSDSSAPSPPAPGTKHAASYEFLTTLTEFVVQLGQRQS